MFLALDKGYYLNYFLLQVSLLYEFILRMTALKYNQNNIGLLLNRFFFFYHF